MNNFGNPQPGDLELPRWLGMNQSIQRPEAELPEKIQPLAAVKWGGVTQILPERVESWSELQPRLLPISCDPRPNDVLVGRVVDLGRHSSVELSSGRRAQLYLGDVLVGAFGNRYATNQYEGIVPGRLEHYHMMSQGAVMGQVVSASYSMSDPTVIEPLGFLDNGAGEPVNLANYGLPRIDQVPRVPVMLVLGSSMDAGKTTTAAALTRGLSLAGWRVHAGKLTGTGCANDINKMRDAGAQRVLDFTSCGYVSTASAPAEALEQVSSRIIEHLSQGSPDLLVLEIADGIVQSDTDRLARMLSAAGRVDGVLLAVHDVLSARTATEIVEQEFGLPVFGVSGAATRSPLSTSELIRLSTRMVYDVPALSHPGIALDVEGYLSQPQRCCDRSRIGVA